ncbi:MAG: crotonase [Gammaproteobacteria bacterium CG11_big_fil_rev_8_21_14_0_20_46_22]|nr:MAG: crotonase [Gammaproteobacteria bacterium CG12_big_fil_rev_8_21_14_0_65_46_12]PIR10864.1 MAG: crotonase [Gammaproteobacteria bacterium CG11_big_fil_rev_8_21_14_0_20_46_22]
MNTLTHWKVEEKANGVVWLHIDRDGEKVNTFNVPLLEELGEILTWLEANKSAKGVVITSAKKTGFVMGADIEQFTKVKDFDQAYAFIKSAHDLFDRLEALKVPTLALINGMCLGGGMELALACDYRIVVEDEKSKLGLPEIKLGIFPGWGGSVRLPRLIGAVKAMGLMLTGQLVSGKAAYKMGIVDAATPARHLETAANAFMAKLPKKHAPSKLEALTNISLVRKILADRMRKQVAKKARKDHYPAPYKLIANWERHGVTKKAFDGEAKAVAELVLGDTAQNLIRVFFLQQRLKGLAKGIEFKPTHVHVIGAGTMGGDIAAWCALRGMTVTLQDREAKYIAPAMKRAAKLYQKKLKKPHLVQLAFDRLVPDVEGRGVAQADVVIEAIFENLEAKQQLFKDLESKMKPGAIMASNTSSIPLDEINAVLSQPERLVGIHFFNPVAMMPLVEVVNGDKTSAEVKDKAVAFVNAMNKLPVVAKSRPGFLVNRCLLPYMSEALSLHEEGVPLATIDRVAENFGMPMGPVELSDMVGLDVCYHVLQNFVENFGGSVPKALKEKVDAKMLGAKTGEGFYTFDPKTKKAIKPEAGQCKMSDDDICDRLILRMLNECVACLREQIVDDADTLDAGMIFGTGFAPFRGGPIHYAKTRGVSQCLSRLNELAEKYGEHLNADDYWKTLVGECLSTVKAN